MHKGIKDYNMYIAQKLSPTPKSKWTFGSNTPTSNNTNTGTTAMQQWQWQYSRQ
jgi:hypothetical protein